MLRASVWVAVGILAGGCSSTKGEQTATSWPVKEAAVPTSEPEVVPIAEPIPEEPSGLEDVIILRASADDPFYGTSRRFYHEIPVIDGERRCAAMAVYFDLPVDDGRIIVLPRSLTRTDEIYGLEMKHSRQTSWVWESQTGLVWATNLPKYDPGADRQLVLRYYPYTSKMPEAMDRTDLLGIIGIPCGPIPQELIESMEGVPAEIEIKVRANGATTTVKMALDDPYYLYKEVR